MEDMMLPADAFRLGSVTVVPSLNRLVWSERTEDLEPRVMRVLAVLAATPGEVVTRADLLDAVWAETIVNEDALTRAVSELRKALADEAGAVETIRGRGYRLTSPVEALSPDRASRSNAHASPQPAEERLEKPEAARRPGALVVLALAVAMVALVVALWAVRPSQEPEPSAVDESMEPDEDPFRLDSTSPYYRPGLSELGVYYDSTEDRHFRFVPDE